MTDVLSSVCDFVDSFGIKEEKVVAYLKNQLTIIGGKLFLKGTEVEITNRDTLGTLLRKNLDPTKDSKEIEYFKEHVGQDASGKLFYKEN